jgi:hypothetical protein
MVEAGGIGKGGRATAAEEMDSTGSVELDPPDATHEGSDGMEGGWRLLIFVFFFRCWLSCWC